jgi:hypothetical protein
MAAINGNCSSICMQGREQASSFWLLASSQTKNPKTNPGFICARLRSSAARNGGRL